MARRQKQPGPDVLINGVRYATVIIDGVQRFPTNRAVRWLINKYEPLNELWRTYGPVDDDLRELYRLIGYSVCGYGDIFPRDKITNPAPKRRRRT